MGKSLYLFKECKRELHYFSWILEIDLIQTESNMRLAQIYNIQLDVFKLIYDIVEKVINVMNNIFVGEVNIVIRPLS